MEPTLTAAPTLVVAAGAPLEPYLDALADLLRTYQPEITPVVEVAVAAGGQLQGRQAGGAAPLADGFEQCLERVLSERHLEQVRESGIAVGVQGGHLSTRVLLVLDGGCPEEIAPALAALREAAARVRQPLPLRLVCLVLTTGADRAEVGFPVETMLREAASPFLQPTGIFVLDRYRSDGSGLGDDGEQGREEIRRVLSFLLFASVLPAAGGEHWLFGSPSLAAAGPCPCHSLGVGMLVVPLPDIERALAHALLADLLERMRRAPDPPEAADRFLATCQLGEALSESQSWRALFAKAPAKTAPDGFAVELLEEQILLQLGQHPWAEWPRRLAEYDTRLGGLAVMQWIRRMEGGAVARFAGLQRALDAPLDAAMREGDAAFPLAAKALETARDLFEGWSCQGPNLKIGVPDPKLADHQQALRQALQAMPNGWALSARAGLLAVAEAYAALGIARAGLAAGSVPTLAIAAVGGAALMCYTAWAAVRQHSDAQERVEKAKDDYLGAIVHKYAGVLRSHGVLLLRELRWRMLERIEALEERLKQTRERFEEVEHAARAEAERFAPPHSSLVRSVVRTWADLEPVARDAWGSRDLQPLLQSLLEAAPGTTFAEACALAEPAPTEPEARDVTGQPDDPKDEVRRMKDESEPPDPDLHPSSFILHPLKVRLAAAAGDLLRRELHDPRVHHLDYYLNLRARAAGLEGAAEWVRAEIRRLYDEGTKVLWTTPHGARLLWQLLPNEGGALWDTAEKAHPEPATTVRAPGILATLSRQEVDLDDGTR